MTMTFKIAGNLAAGREPLLLESDVALGEGLITRFNPLPAYEAQVRRLGE